MNDLTLTIDNIEPMSDNAIAKVRLLESELGKQEQIKMFTDHVIHAGMYSRTILIPAGVILCGSLMKIATLLIISGDFVLFAGDEAIELNGYNVITGEPNRKQAGVAKTDTWVTMIFPTESKIIHDVEDEFTDEADILLSRKEDAVNSIKITGV